MAASGTVTINIVGDTTRLRSALGDAESGLSGFSTKLQSIGDRLTQFGSRMTLGVTLPLALLGRAAFNAASDLNESLNKVDVVFGENAEAIKQWASTAATAMGISTQAALEAAGTFGNLFTALGIGIPTAADMSTHLVQLASDLASFNNADPSEVLEALRSGLVGEIEPLRKFGVALSQARIEAKAMELGLWDGEGAISASAKAQAAYAIVLDDTTTAQGDFARTADDAANKQRTLNAELEDAKGKLGQALLPIFTRLATAVERLSDAFSKLPGPVQEGIVYLGLILVVIGPLTTAIGGAITAFGALSAVLAAFSAPVLAVGAAIAILVGFAVLLYVKWDEVWKAVANNPWLLAILAPLGAILIPIIALVGAIKLVQDHWEEVWPVVQQIAQTAWSILEPIFDFMASAVNAVGDAAKWVWDRFEEAWPTIQEIVQKVWDVLQSVFEFFRGAVNNIGSAAMWVKERAEEAWPIVQSVIQTAWDIVQVPLGLMGAAIGVIRDVISWLKDNAGSAWDAFTNGVSFMWGLVQTPLHALAALLERIIAAARALKTALGNIPGVGGGGIGDVGAIVGVPSGPGFSGGGGGYSGGGGGRASGGGVNAFTDYLVGERGKEIVRIGATGGTVIPNTALGGGRNNTYEINVTVAPGGSPAETGQAIVEAIRAYEDRSGPSWRAA